ncbi:MAG: hypothetical protein EU533_01280, partial [Promethearchaeota archaeon]
MSEQNLQICRFCQRNIKLAYYCEDCGASCCSDCLHEEKADYLVCQECNSKRIEKSDSGMKRHCKDCGSENVIQSSQLLRSCPKCHSTSIINIYEKKEELEKSFLDLIKNVRNFIDPLNEILNTMYQLRQMIKNARAPPIKCFHFSNLEPDLLALFKLFVYAKDNFHEKITILFKNLSLNKEYFFDIYTQPNANVVIIEGILENLTINYESIKEYVSNNVKTISSSLEIIKKNLKFIDKITYYFSTYKKFLNLAEDEKPIYSIHAKLANGLNTHDKYKKSKGVLFITNFDLSFIQFSGRFKKKNQTIFKAPVDDLIKIRIHGKIFKKLYIEFPYGRYEFTLPPNSINKVLDYIVLARNFEETIKFDEEAAQKLDDFYIDLNEITAFVEETINSFFSLKCQYNTQYQKIENQKGTSYSPNTPNHQLYDLPPQLHNNPYQNSFNMSSYGSNKPLTYSREYPSNAAMFQQTPRPENLENYNIYRNENREPPYNTQYENRFIPQTLFNPQRIQNYESLRYPSSPYNAYNPDFDDKNVLMKKLEQANKFSPFEPRVNHPSYDYDVGSRPYSDKRFYNDFSKNHLSELFDSHEFPGNMGKMPKRYSKQIREKQKKMSELEKEKYGIDETLKALDTKFEQGVISEVDYFRTFKNLQKQVYSIDQN